MNRRERPPARAANPAVMATMFARQGPIGQTLSQALNDLVAESFAEQVEQEAQEEDDDHQQQQQQGAYSDEEQVTRVSFDAGMAEEVMKSFAAQVANDVKWEDAPAALMRARLDHYNKVTNKWRIVANQVELRPRVPLSTAIIKKTQRRSLWETSELREEQTPTVSLERSVQILAYNDS